MVRWGDGEMVVGCVSWIWIGGCVILIYSPIFPGFIATSDIHVLFVDPLGRVHFGAKTRLRLQLHSKFVSSTRHF
jgi:hypothetical protein